MALSSSIIYHPVWKDLEAYLHVVEYDKDGGHKEPRIRIDFLGMTERWSRHLVLIEMLCVSCQRPIHPLRRREGDGWDRLYYACACPLEKNKGCSRSRAAALEYERFKGIAAKLPPRPTAQLDLF